MVLKLIIVAGILTLTACATTESVSSANVGVEGKELQTELELAATAEPERKTKISSEVLFLLMTAEIAGQREEYGVALDGYLRAARQVKDPDVIKRAAKIALFVQDDAKLKETLDLWLEVEPNSLGAKYLMGVFALKNGDKQAAIESIEFALLNDPQGFDDKALSMVKSLNDQQSFDLAYQVFTELSVKYPKDASLYFILSLLDVQSKKEIQAQANITKALELEPNWVAAQLLQSQLYIAQGNLAAATDILQQAVAEQDNAGISEKIVQLLMQQGRLEEAELVLQDLIVKSPENAELKLKLALIYLQSSKDAQARELLLDLVSTKQFRDRAAFYLGRMDAKEERYPDALTWFESVEVEPFKFEAGMSTLLVLMEQEHYEALLAKIKLLKVSYPERKNNLILIEAEAYSQQEKYQQGFDVLTAALLEDPENTKILYARALLAEKLGNMQALEGDLSYIISKNPEDANALNALGYTLVDKTTRYAEAKTYLDKAIALKPNEPIIMDSYGWLLFKLNRAEEALTYLQAAYERLPQTEITAHLVEVLWSLGRRDEARKILAESLLKHPTDTLLLDVQTRLVGS